MGNGRPKVRKLKSRVEKRHPLANDSVAARHFYEKVNDQKLQEIMDSRMIQEDHGSIANLSSTPISRSFMANRFMESLGKCDERNDV